MTRRPILVGALPPPITGQAIAFGMLVDAVRARIGPCPVVDYSPRRHTDHLGGWRATWGRVQEYAGVFARFAARAARPRTTVYLIIAGSRRGLLRDALLIGLSRVFRHRVVAHSHGGNYAEFYAAQSPALRWLARMTVGRVDVMIVLGERLRPMFSFAPRLENRTLVVPNGCLTSGLEPDISKELPRSGEGPVRLLFLSNLIESKGYFDLLEAVRLLVSQLGHRDVEAHFAGAFMPHGSDENTRTPEEAQARFERFVDDHELGDFVRYHGVVEGADKDRLLRDSHVFVLPTYYPIEGQPISIIEAMANANVVVATDYRGIPDLVTEGESGRLVPARDPASLAMALHSLITDPAEYRRMSRAALDRYRRDFTAAAHVSRMLSALGLPAA
jgi:glycosyltransferase involved in cell wall biosynthesis